MKNYFLIASLMCGNYLCAATQYVDFHFLNKLKKPVVLTWGFKRQGISSLENEVAAGKEKTDTQLPNEQPIIEFYVKDKPAEKYRYEISTEGKNKVFVRVVQEKNGIKLEPQTSLTRAIKDNVTQSDLIPVTSATITKPHVIQDKKPAAKPMGPLMQAIVRGDSLREIKAMAASGKITAKDFNEKDEYGNSVLTVAEELWREDAIIDFLKSKGAK